MVHEIECEIEEEQVSSGLVIPESAAVQVPPVSNALVIYESPAVQVSPIWTAADRAYGWKFGVAGVVSKTRARELLGGVSRYTVIRLARAGKIRSGSVGKVPVYCLFSILRFIESAES